MLTVATAALAPVAGVVAAAAHELGTPLATIKLIAAELADELDDRPDLQADAIALRDSAVRCAQILRSMGRAGKDDLHLRTAPLAQVTRATYAAHGRLDGRIHDREVREIPRG